ncbi:MAG TPA: creatininase family protein [Planctomycetota bacterium]|nr:creatininase family protein [Planctomycetota bacterium]
MPSQSPHRLAEITLNDVRAANFQAAVLTFGATEPHNLHLPYATDNIQVEHIADRACARAWAKGARVALLPNVPFGADQNLLAFPFAINVDQEILNQIVESVAKSLERHGILKLVLINGHGGNDFKAFLRTLMARTKVFSCLINWYQVAQDVAKTIFENPGDHADEMETSLIQALRPELVDFASADPGAIRKSRFEAMRKGWAWNPRPFDRLTTNSGVGDPRKATPEKGRKFLEVVEVRIADFLVELAAAKMDETFPFE